MFFKFVVTNMGIQLPLPKILSVFHNIHVKLPLCPNKQGIGVMHLCIRRVSTLQFALVKTTIFSFGIRKALKLQGFPTTRTMTNFKTLLAKALKILFQFLTTIFSNLRSYLNHRVKSQDGISRHASNTDHTMFCKNEEHKKDSTLRFHS